jgi:P4 family phage/plasmid primase-like protien
MGGDNVNENNKRVNTDENLQTRPKKIRKEKNTEKFDIRKQRKIEKIEREAEEKEKMLLQKIEMNKRKAEMETKNIVQTLTHKEQEEEENKRRIVENNTLRKIQKLLINNDLFDNSDYNNKACFTNYKQRGMCENWDEAFKLFSNINIDDRIFHEYIPRHCLVKPYLDIEWYNHEFPNLNENNAIQNIIDAVKFVLGNNWELSRPITNQDIYISSCHRETLKGFKYSFHLVVTTCEPTIVFEGTTYCKYFATLVKNLLIENSNVCFKDIIDSGVYKIKQNFRLIGHHKEDEQEYFEPLEEYGRPENEIYDILNVDPKIFHTITYFPTNINVLPIIEQSDNIMSQYLATHENFIGQIIPEDYEFILERVREKCHATCLLTNEADNGGFMQWNYTDRNEPCFISGEIHDQIGFFVFQQLRDNALIAGCHSAKCTDENGKKILLHIGDVSEKNLDPNDIKKISLNERDFTIPFHVLDQAIMEDNVGICTLFRQMYCLPQRIKGVQGDMTFLWNGEYWEQDECNTIFLLISKTIPNVLTTFLNRLNHKDDRDSIVTLHSDKNDMKIKKTTQLVTKLQSMSSNSIILKSIGSYIFDKRFLSIMDTMKHQLSLKNGILNLKTGVIRPALPNDLITRRLQIKYDPDADSSVFDKFIREILSDKNGHRQELYDYFRWLVGYIIQGDPKHKIFIILYGPHGNNGKSIFCDILSAILEFYASPMDYSVIFQTPLKTAGAASPELMQMRFAHVGIITDTPKDAIVNDQQMKQITGGDKIVGRELYKSSISFTPRFVPIVASNHRFKINPEPAMKRRTVVIPFELSFVQTPVEDYERQGDENIKEKLLENKSGILKWFVDSSINYYHGKIIPIKPECIQKEIEKYFIEMDDIKKFIHEHVNEHLNAEPITLDKMYTIYTQFYEESGLVTQLKGSKMKAKDQFRKAFQVYFPYNKKTQSFENALLTSEVVI